MIPEVLAGRYRFVERLGQGGMGEVWLAEDDVRGMKVAVKRILPELARDELLSRRFVREARIHADLEHPKIVKILEVTERPAAIVMTYYPRGSLSSLLESGPLSDYKLLDVLAGIGEALSTVHQAGYLHRDVKSDNILFADDGTPLLSDFGISASTDGRFTSLTMPGFIGTTAYQAPESDEPSTMDARSDLYSLGVTAYQAATGELPFEGETPFHTLRLHRGASRPDPRQIAPRLDERIAAVIMTLMRVEPDFRYQSATDLLADVRAIVKDEETTHATMLPPSTKSTKPKNVATKEPPKKAVSSQKRALQPDQARLMQRLMARKELVGYVRRKNYLNEPGSPRLSPYLSFGTGSGSLSVRYNVVGQNNFSALTKAASDLNAILAEAGIATTFSRPQKPVANRGSISAPVSSIDEGIEIWKILKGYQNSHG